MVTVPKLTKIVPGPDKYNLERNWQTSNPSHTQTMVKGEVNSFLDKIVRDGKKPERTSPSPHVYRKEDAWLKTAPRITGT
jgi:hypothetical protein